jgi:NarL family two-component system response regulator LiaR
VTERIGVLIVDDHPIVREGLHTYLDTVDDIEVVGEASDGVQAVRMVRDTLPDVVLMDLVMPGIDGIEATRRVREISPSTKVVVLTSFAEDEKVFPAIKAGAAGYLLKDIQPTEVVEAIRKVHAGEALLHPTVAAMVMQEVADPRRSVPGHLTERELDVLSHIAQGESNREIARALTVSEKTVKTHVSNILAKLHLADRTQAALYAVRRGMDSREPDSTPEG